MKKVNNYNLQYWLYAILNKKFGTEVKFKRDSLHSRYEVNRHGFYVETNNLPIKEVLKYLNSYLESANFKKEDNIWNDLRKDKIYISFREEDKRFYCMGRVY